MPLSQTPLQLDLSRSEKPGSLDPALASLGPEVDAKGRDALAAEDEQPETSMSGQMQSSLECMPNQLASSSDTFDVLHYIDGGTSVQELRQASLLCKGLLPSVAIPLSRLAQFQSLLTLFQRQLLNQHPLQSAASLAEEECRALQQHHWALQHQLEDKDATILGLQDALQGVQQFLSSEDCCVRLYPLFHAHHTRFVGAAEWQQQAQTEQGRCAALQSELQNFR